MVFPEQDNIDEIAALIPTINPANLGDKFDKAVQIRGEMANEFAVKFAELPLKQLRSYASWAEIGWPLFSAPRLPNRKLSDDEVLQLWGVELSLHELCYCCERLQEVANLTSGGSTPTRFYLYGIYHYADSMFLVDKSKPSHKGLPMGGTVIVALMPMGLADLLDPVNAILLKKHGKENTLGHTILKLRHSHLVHGDFSPQRFEYLVADTRARDHAQQERLDAGIWDLFPERLLLDLRVIAILTNEKPNIAGIVANYVASKRNQLAGEAETAA